MQIARQRVTGRELARRLGVSSQWISQRTRGVVAMDADDMEAVADALGISITDLIADAIRRAEETVPEPQPATRRGRVTRTRTHRYLPPSPTGRPVLTLVTGGAASYPDVSDGNGSSPGRTGSPRVAPSTGAVNDAHSA